MTGDCVFKHPPRQAVHRSSQVRFLCGLRLTIQARGICSKTQAVRTTIGVMTPPLRISTMWKAAGKPAIVGGSKIQYCCALSATARRCRDSNRPMLSRSGHPERRGPERRRLVQRPVAPRRASEPVLEEHPDDSHHRQPAICYLGCELLLFLRWVTGREHLEPEVPLRGWGPWGLVLRELAEGAVCQDLPPTGQRHLGDRPQAVRDVGELQAHGRGKVAGQLACELWRDVAHAGEHG